MFSHFGAYVITGGNHLKIAREACRAGAQVVQYRDKNSTRREILETAEKIREVTKDFNSLFIINDYVDVALISEADGVHLGQDDIPIQRAREITPDGFIIGVSTHSLKQAIEAEKAGADYIGIGPVFATPTKKNYTPIGFSVVREVLMNVSIPVVAIGGINIENIGKLVGIGVRNVAMIRAFQGKTGEKVKKTNFLLKV